MALEAGVATPVSGPVEKGPTTSLGLAVGFAVDVGMALVAAGTGIVTHEVTRDSGEVDEITNVGPHLRTDVTVYHDPAPLIRGGNFGTILRATSTLRLGGCRTLDADGMTPDDQCEKLSDAALGDGLMVSVGALAGIRTANGDTLSVSLSPYYTRSKHPTDPSVALGGVMARITLSGIPKALSGLATLSGGYDYSGSSERHESDKRKNKIRDNAIRCRLLSEEARRNDSNCD